MTNQEMRNNYISTYKLDDYLPDSLLSTLRLIKINTGDYLVTQNSQIKQLFFLVEGTLQVEHYEENGRHIIFSHEKAFSVVGDLELFLESNHISFNAVQALTPCYLLVISISAIKRKAQQDPKFLHFVCCELSRKLYNSSKQLSQSLYSAEFKLRRYLLFKTQQEGTLFQLEKRETIAGILGISIRQLNRALSHLAKLEIIHVKNRTISIINSKLLSEIVT